MSDKRKTNVAQYSLKASESIYFNNPDGFIFIIIKSGNGIFLLNGKKYAYKPGTAVILSCVDYFQKLNDGSDTTLMVLEFFDDVFSGRMLEFFNVALLPHILLLDARFDSIVKLFDMLQLECSSRLKHGNLFAQEFYFYKNVLLHKEQILKEYPDAEVVIISDFPNHVQNEKVLVAAQKAEEIIFCTFCRPQSYQGSDGINERACYLINCFTDKTVSVLHTGNPYEVQKFPVAKRIFLGHLGSDSLKYTLKAMKGEFTPSGKIPVKVTL